MMCAVRPIALSGVLLLAACAGALAQQAPLQQTQTIGELPNQLVAPGVTGATPRQPMGPGVVGQWQYFQLPAGWKDPFAMIPGVAGAPGSVPRDQQFSVFPGVGVANMFNELNERLKRFANHQPDANELAIFSYALAPLKLAYFVEADMQWKTVDLPPQDMIVINCGACSGLLTVSFSNGVAQETTPIRLKSRYMVTQDADGRKWRLEEHTQIGQFVPFKAWQNFQYVQ